MLSALISLVIYLIIAGLIFWAVTQLIAIIPIPEPFARIIHVVMIVIMCLIVIYALLGLVDGVPANLRLR